MGAFWFQKTHIIHASAALTWGSGHARFQRCASEFGLWRIGCQGAESPGLGPGSPVLTVKLNAKCGKPENERLDRWTREKVCQSNCRATRDCSICSGSTGSSEALGAIQEISKIVGSENCKAATPPPGQWQGCRGSGEKGHHRHHWGKDSLLLAWRNTKLTKLTKFLTFFCRPLLHRMLQQPPQRCRDAIFATEVVEA